jgi:hypothetical protein
MSETSLENKLKVEIVQCRIFSDRVHVNTCCQNNHGRCWRKASYKKVVKLKLNELKKRGLVEMIVNEPVLKESK